jgi:hypothetical protein
MTTGNTTLLGLALPVEGELDGTWGDVVNDSITSLVDSAVAGTTTLSADADVTLTTTVLAANQARQAVLLWTASNGATTRNITAPAQSKPYIVINAGTGSIVLRGVGPTTGVTIISGEKCLAAWNGSDFVKVATSTADGVTTISFGSTGLTPSTDTSGAVSVAGTLAVANGGTGLTAGTSGGVLAYTATGVLASSGALAANNVVVGGGAGAAPSSTNLLAISAAVTTGNYIKAIGYADTVTALGNTGAAKNLDVTSGGVFTATLDQTSTITLRFPVATGASSFTLILTNGAGGPFTVTFVGSGATMKFPGGAAALSRTTTASAIDVWFFFTPDGGTTYYGSIPMKNLTT